MANLFDGGEAERLRDKAIESAAYRRRDILERAKTAAVIIANHNSIVTVDDVIELLYHNNAPVADLGNAAGSIFKGDCWEFTGTWVKSRRTSNHCRYVRQWRLKRG